MAQKVLVSMVDDIDGSEATQTVPFALDGVKYAIDLSDENADGLRDSLSDYVAKARRVGGRKRRVVSGARADTRTYSLEEQQRNQAARKWARANGWPDLGLRGPIPSEVITAYEKRGQAQPKKATAKKAVAAVTKSGGSRKTPAK